MSVSGNYGDGGDLNEKLMPKAEQNAGSLAGRKVTKDSVGIGSKIKSYCSIIFAGLSSIVLFLYALPTRLFRRDGSLSFSPSDLGALKTEHKALVQSQFSGLTYRAGDTNTKVQFYKNLEAFSEDLQNKRLSSHEIRDRLVGFTKQPEYVGLADTDRARIFIQDCAHALETTPPDAFRSYGSKRINKHLPLRKLDQSCTFQEVGQALVKAQGEYTSTRDGAAATLLWVATNPEKMPQVESAKLDREQYDSYHNQTVVGHPLKDPEGGELFIQHGPGITGPRSLAQVKIDRCRREDTLWVHVSHQSTHKKDERARIDAGQKLAQENGDVFSQAVLSTDTPDYTNAKVIDRFVKGERTIEAFLDEYEQGLRGQGDVNIRDYAQTLGLHIPEALLNATELEAAFYAAREMVLLNKEALTKICTTGSKTEQKDAREAVATLVKRNILSTLNWAIMKKLQLSGRKVIFSQACKEHVDRGVQEAADLLMNDAMQRGENSLTYREAYRLAGLVLGRAHYAMNRPPQAKRLYPLVERMTYFDHPTLLNLGQQLLTRLRQVLVQETEKGAKHAHERADQVGSLLETDSKADLHGDR